MSFKVYTRMDDCLRLRWAKNPQPFYLTPKLRGCVRIKFLPACCTCHSLWYATGPFKKTVLTFWPYPRHQECMLGWNICLYIMLWYISFPLIWYAAIIFWKKKRFTEVSSPLSSSSWELVANCCTWHTIMLWVKIMEVVMNLAYTGFQVPFIKKKNRDKNGKSFN